MVGGLLVSQALTLFTTPVVYIYMGHLGRWMGPWHQRNQVTRPASKSAARPRYVMRPMTAAIQISGGKASRLLLRSSPLPKDFRMPPSSLPDQIQKVSWLAERRSVAVKRLGAPGPTDAELDLILGAAIAAPDHGALRPWRVIRCLESGRTRLADLFVQSKLQLKPDATEAELSREREKALKPPILLAMLATPKTTRPEVTEAEQIACAGAAMQSILLAAYGLGYGAIILSGSRCADPAVREAFGAGSEDHLLGFISIGSIIDTPIPSRRPNLSDMVGIFDTDGLT